MLELRDKLIAMVRSEIERIAKNYPHRRPGEYLLEDVERAIVNGIKSIFERLRP